MNKLVRFYLLGVMAASSAFVAVNAMAESDQFDVTDKLNLDQAIATIETYFKLEIELQKLDATVGEKQKEIDAAKRFLENFEIRTSQIEGDLARDYHVSFGESLDTAINSAGNKSPDLASYQDIIEKKRTRQEFMSAKIKGDEERLFQDKNYLLLQIEFLKPFVVYYQKLLSEHQELLPQALFRCAVNGLILTMDYIIGNYHPNLDIKTAENQNLLHAAAASGNPKLVQYILNLLGTKEMGCFLDLHCVDAQGLTPIQVTLDKSDDEIAIILLKACGCPMCLESCRHSDLGQTFPLKQLINQMSGR